MKHIMHPINTCLNFTCRQVCIYIPRYLFQIRGREITVVCTVYPVEFAYHVYRFINTFAKTYIRQISEPFIGFTNFVVIIAQRNAWCPADRTENHAVQTIRHNKRCPLELFNFSFKYFLPFLSETNLSSEYISVCITLPVKALHILSMVCISSFEMFFPNLI